MIHNNREEMYFISVESKLAAVARSSKLAMINSELSNMAKLGPTTIVRGNKILKKDKKNHVEIYNFLAHIFVSNTAFVNSSQLLFLTYVSTWSVSSATPLLNDLKYFSLLFSRYGAVATSLRRSSQYYNDQNGLLNADVYTIRSFWYKRRCLIFNSFEQPYYFLSIVYSQFAADTFFSHKSQPHSAEKWFNTSVVEQLPEAYTGHFHIEEL